FGSPRLPPPPQSETIRAPLYRTIEERLASFENFPSDNSIPHQQLAEAGLYFTGEDICCFVNDGCIKGGRLCDKTIGEQDTNCSRDTYRNKSKRYTTRQRDVIKNASTSERNQHSASQTTQGNGSFGSPPPLGYTIRSPRYRTMEARLATFENFPSANNIPHQQFAEA
ncbi:E3 ubiquitin-protein ligase XIAP-like, partial [Ruditapes philippinarum]|uniref:E3 ubiquitin-protein ligase XIAP-like n=1 Tax=Ruditapes philippinarum TaxID=129788 RepID=UPI00295AF0D9